MVYGNGNMWVFVCGWMRRRVILLLLDILIKRAMRFCCGGGGGVFSERLFALF